MENLENNVVNNEVKENNYIYLVIILVIVIVFIVCEKPYWCSMKKPHYPCVKNPTGVN